MKIAVVGTGYVGLVTGTSLAMLEHEVFCIGRDKEKINAINKGKALFYEPGLENILKKLTKKNLLIATDNLSESVQNAQAVIIAVGTPTVENKIDLSAIKKVTEQIGSALKNVKRYQVVVVKSTVVPGTTEKVILPILEKYSEKKIGEFGLCMNPEFLREGNAVEDALRPDRIVIGQYDVKSGKTLAALYSKIKSPIVFTNLQTAELVKYTANSLLATLISFSNEIARIAEGIQGIDVSDVWRGVHLDFRLSPIVGNRRIHPGILHYILSGCGYGGSCFPKDTKALAHFVNTLGIESPILRGVISTNNSQPQRMIGLLTSCMEHIAGKRIAVLGLSFKPNTDDLRDSPALTLIELLKKDGATVICHDPMAYKETVPLELKGLGVVLAETVQEALHDADACMLVTAWDVYKKLTPSIFKDNMKTPFLIDGRRIYNKKTFVTAGILYKGIGLSSI